MLGQHFNLWQGTQKGILESKNTFLPSTHKGWGLSLSLQFSSQYPWDFQFHGKIPSSISMSDEIDPPLRLFSDRISLLWACLLSCRVYLIISHLICSEHSFLNPKVQKYKSTIFLSSKLHFVICHKKIQSTNYSFKSVPTALNYSAMTFLYFHTIVVFLTNATTQLIHSSLNLMFCKDYLVDLRIS